MKNSIAAAAASAIALIAGPALAEADYVTIEMSIDVDAPAETVWERVGEYCDISEWAPMLACEITSGDGGVGTVRSLAGGQINEILVGMTELSYGYTHQAVEGRFYDQYHGFMEARPVTEETSEILYTLMYDASQTEDKEADMAQRRTMFEGLLATMKEIAEAD